MLAVHAALAAALLAAASALPAAFDDGMVADESGVSQWNEPAIAIGMFSGGRRRRTTEEVADGEGAGQRQRRQDLAEDFGANDGDDVRKRRQAPRRGVESPFGQTSDTEDRVRRDAQEESQEDNGPVDNEHFPTADEGKRARRGSEDAYFDDAEDDDDAAFDEAPAPVRRRQVVGQDVDDVDDEDVYRDLDDQPLPVWARGTQDGRGRRQLPDENMMSMDDDQPDYIREPRGAEAATTASPTEGPGAATEAPEEAVAPAADTETEVQDGEDKTAESAAKPEARNVPQEAADKPEASPVETSTASAAPSSSTETIYYIVPDEEVAAEASSSVERRPSLRQRRSPQRGRFDGFVLADFSGFRSGRSVRARRDAPSESTVIKTLLEAPIDETILGELPVRRPRQIAEALPQVASGPLTYLVPLAAPQPDQDAGNASAAQKVLQIYTEHGPSPDMTTTTPAPTVPLVPVLVPESAVSGILAPGPGAVQVDVVADDAAMAQPSPALLQPVVALVPPEAVQQAAAAQPAQAAAQPQPVLVLQPGPVLASPVTPAPPAPQAAQAAPLDIPLEIPQDVTRTMAQPPQEALPQDAVPAPLVVSQTAHAVAVTEGPAEAAAPTPFMVPPQEPLPQGMPAMPSEDWIPAQPMFPAPFQGRDPAPFQGRDPAPFQGRDPAPFQGRDPAPPRQHFDRGPVRWSGAVPIVEKTIQMHPDGTYMYSYETADGVRVAEAGVLKEVPGQDAANSAPVLANTVQGGYSYTAPDGTYVSLRYIADENGFRPVLGESLPTLPTTNARAAVRFDEK